MNNPLLDVKEDMKTRITNMDYVMIYRKYLALEAIYGNNVMELAENVSEFNQRVDLERGYCLVNDNE